MNYTGIIGQENKNAGKLDEDDNNKAEDRSPFENFILRWASRSQLGRASHGPRQPSWNRYFLQPKRGRYYYVG